MKDGDYIKMENEKKWMIVAFFTAAFIFITIGFVIGNLVTDKGCTGNPLVYGIKEINVLNDDRFTCSCRSSEREFAFDESGILQSDPYP